MTDPLVEYERRRALRQLAADHLGAQIDRLGQWRIGLVMAGVATGIFGSVSGLFLPGLGAVVLLPMAVLFVIGVRLDKRKRWEARIARHYEHGLRRVSGSWMGRGIAGDRFERRKALLNTERRGEQGVDQISLDPWWWCNLWT